MDFSIPATGTFEMPDKTSETLPEWFDGRFPNFADIVRQGRINEITLGLFVAVPAAVVEAEKSRSGMSTVTSLEDRRFGCHWVTTFNRVWAPLFYVSGYDAFDPATGLPALLGLIEEYTEYKFDLTADEAIQQFIIPACEAARLRYTAAISNTRGGPLVPLFGPNDKVRIDLTALLAAAKDKVLRDRAERYERRCATGGGVQAGSGPKLSPAAPAPSTPTATAATAAAPLLRAAYPPDKGASNVVGEHVDKCSASKLFYKVLGVSFRKAAVDAKLEALLGTPDKTTWPHMWYLLVGSNNESFRMTVVSPQALKQPSATPAPANWFQKKMAKELVDVVETNKTVAVPPYFR
jgi:hypothetical protein